MKLVKDQDGPSLAAIVALIEHSQIVPAEPDKAAARFLAGFGDVDIAILQWIAGEPRARLVRPI